MNLLLKKYFLFKIESKKIMQKNYEKKHEYLGFKKPVIDRCINCGYHEQVHAHITMEFGEGNYNSGPICRKCYSTNRGPNIAQF
jgi:hypothetical protein